METSLPFVMSLAISILANGDVGSQGTVANDHPVQDGNLRPFFSLPFATGVNKEDPMPLGTEAVPDTYRYAVAPNGPPDNQVKTQVGAAYLRPYWSKNSFHLPPPAGSKFAFGDWRDTTQQFNVMPLMSITYGPPPDASSFTFLGSFSGYLVSATSSDDQTISNANGQAKFSVTNNLNITVINILEGVWAKEFPAQSRCLTISFGPRYAHIDQTFVATITAGANQTNFTSTNLTSSQSFSGFGLTSAIEWHCPFHDEWKLGFAGIVRGSALVGSNTRKSSFIGATSNDISDTKTSLVPIGEVYAGIEYTEASVNKMLRLHTNSDISIKGVIFLGLTGQIWGEVDPKNWTIAEGVILSEESPME
jgi:hypothetical protein